MDDIFRMEITLAKALKLKKRIAAEISRIDGDIKANNSLPKEATKEVNVGELLNRRTQMINYMIGLKLSISEANRPIMQDILLVAELKAEAALVSGLDTRHGMVKLSDYDDGLREYEAFIRKPQAAAMVSRSQATIDSLQEKLDTFNYTTKITVPENPLVQAEQSAPESEVAAAE